MARPELLLCLGVVRMINSLAPSLRVLSKGLKFTNTKCLLNSVYSKIYWFGLQSLEHIFDFGHMAAEDVFPIFK